jgi:hypothetical protein
MSNIKYKGEKKYVKLEFYEWYLVIGSEYNHVDWKNDILKQDFFEYIYYIYI